MKRLLQALLALPIIACVTTTGAQTVPAPAIDPARAWFQPSLTAGTEPICAAVLEVGRARFFAPQFLEPPLSPGELAPLGWSLVDPGELSADPLDRLDSILKRANASHLPQHIVAVRGQRLHVQLDINPGCGGGCESRNWLVADAAAAEPAASPQSHDWPLYRSESGDYYTVALVAKQFLEVLRFGGSELLQRVCRVEMRPANLEAVANPAVQSALASVRALESAYGEVVGTEGHCGSLRSLGRARQRAREGYEEAIVRPWALAPFPGPDTSALAGLHLWSVMGLYEQRSAQALGKSMSEASLTLASFYARAFGLSASHSAALSEGAIANAVALGFSFGESSRYPMPESEQALRQAILQRQPIAVVRGYGIPEGALEKTPGESLLNVAVAYPEALAYLLAQGLDPNRPNDFGKTPLMYAAQNDALEGARILIRHGADPNAVTTQASDSCYYTLETTNVTALHYAVRNASAALVKLLLESGSATYIAASGEQPEGRGAYPLDWLRFYTAADSAERNANVSTQEAATLASLLGIPESTTRARISRDLTRRAQSDYARGRSEEAYRLLRNALHADPGNSRARSDLSLIALKAGRLGESLEASELIAHTARDAGSRANAWFNIGLACERAEGSGWPQFNGQFYCQHTLIFPFLQAWRTQPQPARESKVRELFSSLTRAACVADAASADQPRYLFMIGDDTKDDRSDGSQRLYVQHSPAQADLVGKLSQQIHAGEGPKRARIAAKIVDRYDFDGFTVTALETGTWPYDATLEIGGQRCRPSRR